MTLLISCEAIGKSYGSRLLFNGISLGIFRGDKIGVVGPNGSGKSTLLKILAGLEVSDTGQVSAKRSLRIGYVPQDSAFPDQTVEEVLLNAYHEEFYIDDHQKQVEVSILLGKIGFDNPDQPANTLSGGWKKRLEIAKQLINSPDILLLDEPTNHLDLEGILWLERFLLQECPTYLVISHDRYFLENVATKIMEIDKSYPSGIFTVEGSYSTFLEKRDEFLSGQVQYERSLSSKVRREIEWLKQNPKARTTKSTARIQEAGRLIQELSNVKSRNKQTFTELEFSATQRETKKLIAVKNLTKSIGGKQLFAGIEFTLTPGMRLGILGANGSGKTTLLKLLSGEILPDKGTIKSAEGLQIVYFDQQRAQIPLDTNLRRALSPLSDTVKYRGQSIHVNAWAQRFHFPTSILDMQISELSGGERARILVARLMLQPADVLLLDEPTNDLDIPTLEILEESLLEFPGAIVLITHDRLMLDSISTVILGLGSQSETNLFADYSQWQAFQDQQKQQKTTKSAPEAPPLPSVATKSSKKISYKEEQELKQMEGRILTLEENVATLQKRLEDPLVALDAKKLQEACEVLHQAQDQLEQLYRRWQELEDRNR